MGYIYATFKCYIMKDYVSIRVNPDIKERFIKLSKRLGVGQAVLVDKMIHYFVKTGLDPDMTEAESTSVEIKKLRETLISFIRNQEKSILLPVKEQVNEQSVALAKFLNETSHLKYGNESSKSVKEIDTEKLDRELFETKKALEKYRHNFDLIQKSAEPGRGRTVILNMSQEEFNKLF